MLFKYFVTGSVLSQLAVAANWNTYPQVPQTASINGFADPIYDKLPSCATDCVKYDTGNTPCPYWDTGCLCVMPQWSGYVGKCAAESCDGENLKIVTSLALSLCSSVGANMWYLPASVSTEINDKIASDTASVAASATSVVALETSTLNSYFNSTVVTTAIASKTSDASSAAATSSTSSADGTPGMAVSAGVFTLLFTNICVNIIFF